MQGGGKQKEKHIHLDQLQIFFFPVEAQYLANGEYSYTNYVNNTHGLHCQTLDKQSFLPKQIN